MVMCMQLPEKAPLVENAVVTSSEELSKLIQEGLEKGQGIFLKIFAKDAQGKYYITVLTDRTKLLIADGLVVDTGQQVKGSEAVEVLRSIIGKPMIVDVYSLDELEVKLAIAENLEIYSETPKVELSTLLGTPPLEKPKPSTPREEAPKPAEKPPEARPTPPQPQPVSAGGFEVVVNFKKGSMPRDAFEEYSKAIAKEANRIRGISIQRVEFDADVGEGVVYLDVTVYGHTESKERRDIEIEERKIFHIVSRHAPIILRVSKYKPILRNVKVILNGKEVKPREVVDKEKKKTDYVTRDKRVQLAVLEDVWPQFSNFARMVIGDIENAGMRVTRAFFDVKGRREFEINLAVVIKGNVDKDTAERTIRVILTKHARELSRLLNRYITVRKVNVEIVETAPEEAGKPKITSGKAAEILARKELLEKEVERLLQQAGLDEFAQLTEEKKKEAEDVLIKKRLEPALDEVKSRLYSELKLVPRVTFKWLKLNHEIIGSTAYVDIEASFAKEKTGGLFGAYSSVSNDRIRADIIDVIKRIIKDVSSEYSVSIKPRKLNIILR
jgi:hypothetical protein